MNRPHSRGELRKRAMLAFAARNRQQMLRRPGTDETPLSPAEVEFAVQRGLIGFATPAPARANQESQP